MMIISIIIIIIIKQANTHEESFGPPGLALGPRL